MKRNVALCCVALALAVAVGPESARAADPSFTISGSNVTMSNNSGGVVIPLTLTSVNGFTGVLTIGCLPPTPAAGVKEASCVGTVLQAIDLPANGTAAGSADLFAYVYIPIFTQEKRSAARASGAANWAMAGVFLLGIGLVRARRRLRSGFVMAAVGMLIGVTGISGCGSADTLTAGTYTYTVTAYYGQGGRPTLTAFTTVQVTVPPGVLVQKTPPAMPAGK